MMVPRPGSPGPSGAEPTSGDDKKGNCLYYCMYMCVILKLIVVDYDIAAYELSCLVVFYLQA